MPEALNEKKIADFRRRICEVATRQFAREGVDKVSMRSLAKELGYSATALYSYYRNKEEILAATRAAALERLAPRLRSAVDGATDAGQQLRALAGAYLHFARNEPAAYQLIFMPGQQPSTPELDAGLARVRQSLTACFERLLHQRQTGGDADRLGQALWATMHGAIALETAGKLTIGKAGFDDFYHLAVEATLSGACVGSATATGDKQPGGRQFSLDF